MEVLQRLNLKTHGGPTDHEGDTEGWELLMALWALLLIAIHLGIPLLSVFGDSHVIISWVNKIASLNTPLPSHWCDDILSLLHHVSLVTINHIYREHN